MTWPSPTAEPRLGPRSTDSFYRIVPPLSGRRIAIHWKTFTTVETGWKLTKAFIVPLQMRVPTLNPPARQSRLMEHWLWGDRASQVRPDCWIFQLFYFWSLLFADLNSSNLVLKKKKKALLSHRMETAFYTTCSNNIHESKILEKLANLWKFILCANPL